MRSAIPWQQDLREAFSKPADLIHYLQLDPALQERILAAFQSAETASEEVLDGMPDPGQHGDTVSRVFPQVARQVDGHPAVAHRLGLAEVVEHLLLEVLGERLAQQGYLRVAQVAAGPDRQVAALLGGQRFEAVLGDLAYHLAGYVKLDANGQGTAAGVPAGTYYLLCQVVANNHHLVWDLKVELHPGTNTVTLDSSNIALLDEQPPARTTAATQTGENKTEAAAATALPPAPKRPEGSKNSVLGLKVISAAREPIGRTVFYLLDDDFEHILTRAGFQRQMFLGKELPLLNSFELLKRWMNIEENSPMASLMKSMGGGSVLPEDVKEQYAIAVKALSAHTVATVKTNIYGKAAFPREPAGTYHVYGTANAFVKTGEQGTITSNTVNLSDTGYQQATIWNVETTIKPGQNTLILTPDNAAFTGD